jgi:hypothetical protein
MLLFFFHQQEVKTVCCKPFPSTIYLLNTLRNQGHNFVKQ